MNKRPLLDRRLTTRLAPATTVRHATSRRFRQANMNRDGRKVSIRQIKVANVASLLLFEVVLHAE